MHMWLIWKHLWVWLWQVFKHEVENKKKKTKVKLDIVVVGWVGIGSLILNVLLAWSYKRSEFCLTTKTNTWACVTIWWGVELRWTMDWLIVGGMVLTLDHSSLSLSYFLVQLPPNSHQLSRRRRWKAKMVRENKKSKRERCWTLFVGSPLVSLSFSFFFFNGERMKLSMFPSNNRAMMACCMMVCEMIWMHWWCDGLWKK